MSKLRKLRPKTSKLRVFRSRTSYQAEFTHLQKRFEACQEYLRNLVESELSNYKRGEWATFVALKVEDDPDLSLIELV